VNLIVEHIQVNGNHRTTTKGRHMSNFINDVVDKSSNASLEAAAKVAVIMTEGRSVKEIALGIRIASEIRKLKSE